MKTKPSKPKVVEVTVVYTWDGDERERHAFKTQGEANAFMSGFEAGQQGDGYCEAGDTTSEEDDND
jgi:hypothetical protein